MNKNLEEDKNQDKIEIVKQTQEEQQRIFVGSLRPEKNHTLFEFDIAKKEVRKAEFKKDLVVKFEQVTSGSVSARKEVDIKDGCFYVSALNEKNAWRKLKQRFNNVSIPQ